MYKVQKHIIDKICPCKYCQMIDCLFGDPLLSKWESDFVESISRWGWQYNYTQKQKVVIKKVFQAQKKVYSHQQSGI